MIDQILRKLEVSCRIVVRRGKLQNKNQTQRESRKQSENHYRCG